MTEAFFEIDSMFPVLCFTEGSEAAKPNVSGVDLTVTMVLLTPLVSLSTPLQLLLPYSHFRLLLSCPALLLGAAKQMGTASW